SGSTGCGSTIGFLARALSARERFSSGRSYFRSGESRAVTLPSVDRLPGGALSHGGFLLPRSSLARTSTARNFDRNQVVNQAAVATTAPSLPAAPRLRDRLAARRVLARLSSWRAGAIMLVLPDGAVLRYGDSASERPVTITVKSWAFFWRALVAAD